MSFPLFQALKKGGPKLPIYESKRSRVKWHLYEWFGIDIKWYIGQGKGKEGQQKRNGQCCIN